MVYLEMVSNFNLRISESYFLIACNVENPHVGPDGASAIFGPQKDASAKMVDVLNHNLTNVALVIEELTGISLHGRKGAGAAGGAGGLFKHFSQVN